MQYGFRVCFKSTGVGTLSSNEATIEIPSPQAGITFKLNGAGSAVIGQTDRFSITGEPFDSEDGARRCAVQAQQALLIHATRHRRGIDLGMHVPQSFYISPHFKEEMAKALGIDRVVEDHLGITVFRIDQRHKFVGIGGNATVSSRAEQFTAQFAGLIGSERFLSDKAENAAGLY